MNSLAKVAWTLLIQVALSCHAAEPVTQQSGQPAHTQTCVVAKTGSKSRSYDDYIVDVNTCIAESDFAGALTVALQLTEKATQFGDVEQRLRAKLVESAVYRYLDLLPESLALINEVIGDPAARQFPSKLYAAHNNAADVLLNLGRLEEAQANALTARELAEQTGIDVERATAIGTLGQIALRTGRLAEARQHAHDCLKIGETLQSSSHLTHCGLIIAQIYIAQMQWQAALDQINEVIRQSQARGYMTELPRLLHVKAESLHRLQQNDQAVAIAEQGISLAQQSGQLQPSLLLWQLLGDIWQATGQPEKALAAGQARQRIAEKLFDSRLANALAAERAKLEVAKKEQEIAALKQQNILQQASADAARAQRTAAVALSLFVLAVFVIGYGRWMHRRDMQRAEAANRELKLLNDLKDQVLANTSHELRTPLNGIIGLSDILLAEEAKRLSPEAAETLQMIHDCGSQLSHLVDDILDYSRLRADKLPLHLATANMADLVEDVCNVLRPLASNKGLVLSSLVDATLPPVEVDAARIKQVLHNLIGNAIKFSEAGAVTISAEREGDWLMVQVKDSGIGIAPDRLERVFEPFEQADGSSNRRFGGAGLGLPIARQLVEAHGGQLTVESQPGQGSIFRFRLPLA